MRTFIFNNSTDLNLTNANRYDLWVSWAFEYIFERAGIYDCRVGSNDGGWYDDEGTYLTWNNRKEVVQFAWKYKDHPDLKWKLYEEFMFG